jgi:glycosyltransferase involved in cell wall biosynthesis
MKEDNFFWKYKYEPGKKLKNKNIKNKKIKPLVSIITSYYNSNEFMWQTINCVFNQTFQSWEWIIVDDGSTNQEAIDYLKKVEKLDSRIKIYHKQNEGLALGRDYAIQKTSTNYILPLDADDLIEPTYIETLYFTLETNPDASWAFTNSVGFGKYIYLSDQKFDSERMKTDNHITATALIRKEKILQLGGYGKAKRYVNEDWHLWLRMLANGMFPVQVGFYGFWYRRRKESLLTDINNEKKKEYELKIRDLKIEADKIKERIEAIYYPKEENTFRLGNDKIENTENIEILNKNQKSNIYILPYLGTDNKMYKRIKKEAKENDIYIITMQKNEHSPYFYRQKYEEFCTIYDLTTFIDEKYWISFIKYLIDSRHVEKIYVSNTKYKEELKKNFEITDIEECRDSNKKYKLKILQYKISHSLVIRGFRKLGRCIFRV